MGEGPPPLQSHDASSTTDGPADLEPSMTTMTTAADLATLSGAYQLDPAHSRIGFVARHAMVTKVRGSFNDFSGAAVLDGADPTRSTATVTIKAASIDT